MSSSASSTSADSSSVATGVEGCNSPGAVGKWQDITPRQVPFPPPVVNGQPTFFGSKAPLIDPLNSAILYLGVDKHGLFKSTDCGASWKKINTGRNSSILDSGAQWSMVIDPIDSWIIYANNGYGSEKGLWKSVDGGVNWDQTIPVGSEVEKSAQDNFVSIVSMDPTDHKHIVVSFHDACFGAYAPGCLAETRDAAVTWKLIKLPTGGAEASGVKVIDSQHWLFGVPGNGLWQTTDAGTSWNKVADDGGYNLYRASTGVYYLAGGYSMLRSVDHLHWTSLQAASFFSVMGNGTIMYASPRYCDTLCYFTSVESDGTNWAAVQQTQVSGHGAVDLLYDPVYHFLYSSNESGGFWRALVQ